MGFSKKKFSCFILTNYDLLTLTDAVLLREGLKLARKIGQTAPLSSILGDEVSPGPNVQSDEDWENWLRGSIGTEYHPSCSCAMLPKDMGGVVDSALKVYGLGE